MKKGQCKWVTTLSLHNVPLPGFYCCSLAAGHDASITGHILAPGSYDDQATIEAWFESVTAADGSVGRKDDSGKRRWSLLPWAAVTSVVDVLEYGARKYAPDNWRKVENPRQRYFDATQRHLLAWWGGETKDLESGHSHLSHACCCLLFLIAFEIEETDVLS